MMKVLLLDLKAQYSRIQCEIREAIERVVESQLFILGPEVEGLEWEIGAFCKARYAIGLCFETQRRPLLYRERHFSNPLVEAFI
jgi:dTDP-4-amino-4,6-dideoxygalactose transaminase